MKSELWLQGRWWEVQWKKKLKKVLNSAEQTADLYYELNTCHKKMSLVGQRKENKFFVVDLFLSLHKVLRTKGIKTEKVAEQEAYFSSLQ